MQVSLDRRVERAVRETVREKQLPEQVADRLLAWLDELASGRTQTGKSVDNKLYFEGLRAVIPTSNPAEDRSYDVNADQDNGE